MKDRTGVRVNLEFWVGVIVSTLFFISVTLLPFAGSGVIIFLPLPTLLFYIKLGRGQGGAVCLIALTITVIFLNYFPGTPSALPLLIIAGLMGMVLAELIAKGYGFGKTIAIGSAALALFSAGSLFYASLRMGSSPWQLIESYLATSIQENIKLYAQLDLAPEQMAFIKDNAPQLLRFFLTVFPSVALVGIVLSIWVNLLAARFILRKGGVFAVDYGDLSRWKAPERLIWTLIVAGGLLILPNEAATIVGVNVLILCCFVYLLQGLAIVSYFFRTKNVPKLVRFLFYALLVLQQYLLLIVAAFGMFDLWVDFRRFIKPREDPPL